MSGERLRAKEIVFRECAKIFDPAQSAANGAGQVMVARVGSDYVVHELKGWDADARGWRVEVPGGDADLWPEGEVFDAFDARRVWVWLNVGALSMFGANDALDEAQAEARFRPLLREVAAALERDPLAWRPDWLGAP